MVKEVIKSNENKGGAQSMAKMVEKVKKAKGKKEFLQFEVYLLKLDPTVGAEINKKRPCLIVSNSIANEGFETVWILPITSKVHNFPTRIPFLNDKEEKNYIAVDQLRVVDKGRLSKYLYTITDSEVIDEVYEKINLMLYRKK
ncbi:type II toxin-antitoxin system PemK/MazF family toxin [Fusobacterium ulcerans]|uniref:type II toxin-antitoxin system PemK/MazF family toxin n=1 Tax=Fusobacterium ulcerans TaxID=861 RepID=UPI0026715446|nr:type II toxin-antitoxin system PemK/MazF family toxin [Fusobacterium ulcerans]